MNEIKCPNCGEVFQIDQADYAAILNQVRDSAFHAEVDARLRLEIEQAVSDRELRIKELEKTAAETEAVYKFQLDQKDKEIERITQYKLSQNVKLLGESLEQHCAMTFEQYREMAFPNAEFDKDNTSADGTKGDFIYREALDEGVPLLSIMFEMKTESDISTNKKKNTDHLAKLDQDRKKKDCEYAVLVSTLEADNPHYNTGIVPVHGYEKMYVIRPQFFITLIFLLRNAALSTADIRRELAVARQQELDVQQFSEKLGDFKVKFSKEVERAQKKFGTAIDEIDKTIEHLQKVKEALLDSGDYLGSADKKAQDLSIKKLVSRNPGMKAKFIEAGVEVV